uniref:Uncharacterized protein n=1 Tax=Heterorhabditis bacteriophora TaxID=37862 RepID=A0A1I7WE90_HETBA
MNRLIIFYTWKKLGLQRGSLKSDSYHYH